MMLENRLFKKRPQFINRSYLFISTFVFCVLVVMLSISSVWGSSSPIPDSKIKAAIERSFSLDSAVYNRLVNVNTENGIVILSGQVDNLLTLERVVEIAQTVKGVKSVVNNMTVQPRQRQDYEIEFDLHNSFLRDPATETYEIRASVNNGEVSLTGKVDSYQEKVLAGKIAKGVNGVREINNRILVDFKNERFDQEIQADIKRRLEMDVWVFDETVEVQVEQGKVKLSGVVNSEKEKNRVRFDSWVSGVKGVDDTALKTNSWIRSDLYRKKQFKVLNEKEIEKTLNEALALDPRVNPFSIQVQVAGHTVTLEGEVDNLRARQSAEKTAANTVGVGVVKNNIQISIGEKRSLSDFELEREIEQAFERHLLIEKFDIDVKVENGRVFIYGEVDTQMDKARVEDQAAAFRGVEEINNHLSVRFSWPWKSDEDIRKDIENELFWSFLVDFDEIEVTVENGIAKLTGSVSNWKEVRAAVQNAFEGGAKKVKTLLKLGDRFVINMAFDYRYLDVDS